MKWDELELYCAIHRVRMEMINNGEKPGADCWTAERAVELTRRITVELIRKPNTLMVNAWRQFRKTPSSDEDKKKLDIIVELCMESGAHCFYQSRDVGECSDDVHLDRIIPGSEGGLYVRSNCILACGRHNTMRGDMPLAQFLSRGFKNA